MYKETKPKLDVDGQIQHLIEKGVKFEISSVEHAKAYLTKNNNYFKLSAYRKNFPKHSGGEKSGQYIDLDFAMLTDLAIIDMRMRYTFLLMALDIEHYMKVSLLQAIECSEEDGYGIVSDYIEKLRIAESNDNGTAYTSLMNELSRNKDNPYCGGLINKYENEYPIWAFIEVISFGRLINFYKFCADRLDSTNMTKKYYLLLSVKELRNAAAHSNCLINDLSNHNQKHKLDSGISRALSDIGIKKETRDKKCKNETIRQIVTLLYAYKNIVTSDGVYRHKCEELHQLTERMFSDIDLYEKNLAIKTTFEFLKKIIDNWFKYEYNK